MNRGERQKFLYSRKPWQCWYNRTNSLIARTFLALFDSNGLNGKKVLRKVCHREFAIVELKQHVKRLRVDVSCILLPVEFYHSKVLILSHNVAQYYLRNTLAVPSNMYLTPWKLVSLENSDTLGAVVIWSSNVSWTCVMKSRVSAHRAGVCFGT